MSKQRQVWPTDQVTHLWANQAQDSARNPQGNLSFSGRELTSYRTLIGVHCGDFVILSHDRHSNTTAKQLSRAAWAARPRAVYYAPVVAARWNDDDGKQWRAAQIVECVSFFAYLLGTLADKFKPDERAAQAVMHDYNQTRALLARLGARPAAIPPELTTDNIRATRDAMLRDKRIAEKSGQLLRSANVLAIARDGNSRPRVQSMATDARSIVALEKWFADEKIKSPAGKKERAALVKWFNGARADLEARELADDIAAARESVAVSVSRLVASFDAVPVDHVIGADYPSRVLRACGYELNRLDEAAQVLACFGDAGAPAGGIVSDADAEKIAIVRDARDKKSAMDNLCYALRMIDSARDYAKNGFARYALRHYRDARGSLSGFLAVGDEARAYAVAHPDNAERIAAAALSIDAAGLAVIETEARAARDLIAAEDAAKVEKWRAGESVDLWNYPDILLRRKGEQIETSRGAIAPLSVAAKLWRLVGIAKTRGEDLTGDFGESARVGHFTLRAVRADGSLVIGCHDIGADEVARFAGVLGFCGQ